MARPERFVEAPAPGMPEAGKKIIDALGGIATPLRDVVRAVKWSYIDTVARRQHYHFGNTARALGMQRNTLQRQIDELGMRDHLRELMAGERGAE